jgi:hypothetical protein
MSNFEKQIKQQGDDFSMEPRPQVWHRVEAELDKKKDRRIAGWWWMTPLVLLLGGGIFYYAVLHKENTQQPNVSNSKQLPGNSTPLTIKDDKTTTEKNAEPSNTNGDATNRDTPSEKTETSSTSHSNTIVLSNKKPASSYDKNKNTYTPVSTNSKITTSSTAASIAALDDVTTKQQTGDLVLSAKTKPSNVTEKDKLLQAGVGIITLTTTASNDDNNTVLPSEKNDVTPANSTTDSILAATVPLDSTVTTDSITATSKAVAVTKPVKEKIRWRISVAGGITNNTKSDLPFALLVGDRSKAYADLQNSTGGNPATSVSSPLQPNKSGISFSASLQRLQWCAKRWQWQAGIGFQYHQIQQHTGNRKDSAILQSPSNDFSYNTPYFYTGGAALSHTGQNFRTFLSNDLAFSLLKNKRSLLLTGGIYTGFNLYNNYLVGDYNNDRYIKSSDLYKKWFAGFDLGIEFNFKTSMSIGITTRRDFTSSYTSVGGDKQYWQSFLLNVGIPLNKK